MSKLKLYIVEILLIGLMILLHFIDPPKSFMNWIYIFLIINAFVQIFIHFKRKKEVIPHQLRIADTKDSRGQATYLIFGGFLIISGAMARSFKDEIEVYWFLIFIAGLLYFFLSYIFIERGFIEFENNKLRFYDGKLKKTFALDQVESIEFIDKDMILTEANGDKFHLSQMDYNSPNLQELSEFLTEKLSSHIAIKINKGVSH